MTNLDLGLYVVTSQEISMRRSTYEVVEKAVKGGARTIQLREKGMTARELVELGKKVRGITREKDVYLIVNDRVDIAMAVEADGVHLGKDDFPFEDAKKLLGERFIIGLSVDNADEAVEAEKIGADYVGLGPMFKTTTKTDTGPVVGVEGLSKVKSKISIPLVAIGGINRENASEVVQAGADSIAVVGAVTKAENMEKAAGELVDIIKKQG